MLSTTTHQILIIFIKFDRIVIPDQETIVYIRLTWYSTRSPYGCLNNGKERLKKFDAKSDEAIFLSYSSSSKTFRVFNKKTLVVEELIHIIFDETYDLPSRKSEDIDDWCVIIDSTKNNSTHYVGRMSRDRIIRDLGLSWDCKIKERSIILIYKINYLKIDIIRK